MKPYKTGRQFSRVDLEYLTQTTLPPEKAVKVEAIKSGLTERTIRRQIRKAQGRGHQFLTF
jgi:hypothetical protein